jgi:hypothetical protein
VTRHRSFSSLPLARIPILVARNQGTSRPSPGLFLPGIDLLPPGIGNAEDAGIDYFETVRDQNIGQIDQILQGMAPAAPSTPTGGGCQ